jgi:ABC-type uncharacterized transport system ATPase subunit
MLSAEPALDCQNITVNYGAVTALANVSAAFEPGLIHAVVGQNGAGKTTFARVAAGLVKASTGQVSVNGVDLPGGKVADARAAGVELVHQSFALPPSFSVAEAMEFGSTKPGKLFSKRSLNARWMPHLKDLGIDVDPNKRIRDLPVETQQGVEIARALVVDAKLLILDEPTAVLSPYGIENLFDRVRRLKEMGVTVLLILHKIREVLAVADTVTVLRGGALIAGPLPCKGLTSAKLAGLIIGDAQEIAPSEDMGALTGTEVPIAPHPHGSTSGTPIEGQLLDLSNVTTIRDGEGPALSRLNLTLCAGEIVGVAGIEGNGQRTLVRAIAGLVDLNEGDVVLDGKSVTAASLAKRRAQGLRIIPFERNVEGLSLTSALWENWSAGELLQGSLLKSIHPRKTKAACDVALKSWDVRYHDCAQPAGSLSGGNAQKVILAREMDDAAQLILAAQPTRGLDIGATAFVWDALRAARDRGCGILLISSDLDELFDISDRVIVMLSGQVVGDFKAPYDITAVGAAMTGANA